MGSRNTPSGRTLILSEGGWLWRYILYGVLAVCSLLLIVYLRYYGGTAAPASIPTPLPAFPGAEGFGSATPGGRYGRVLFVTNLNDTTDVTDPKYAGSLRWALDRTWADDPNDPYDQRRIIIFKTGGLITLVEQLILKDPFVTIAGQTAPGDGITLRGGGLVIASHDVIVRGIRVRVGDREEPACCLDGINISTHHAGSDVYNVIIDHSSVSWAIDENVSTWIDPAKPYTAHDITLQWNVISEGLHNSIHLDEGASVTDPHSMGAILGQDGTYMTVHHNLFAHNWGRNPRISGIVNSEIINNVMYGWGNAAVEINQDLNVTHVLNNYFKANSGSGHEEIVLSDRMDPQSRVYLDGNLADDPRTGGGLGPARFKIPDGFQLSHGSIFTPGNVSMTSAQAAYAAVLNFAGALSPVRDAVDQRIVEDVRNGTGGIIDSQSQVGGWPDYQSGSYPQDTDQDGIPDEWETARGLDPDSAGDAVRAATPGGYTWLEEYINSLIPFPPVP